MTGPATTKGVLAHGLQVAGTSLEALRFWARTASPGADLVAAVDAVALCPSSAVRRQGSGWLPVALPPVHVKSIPAVPHVSSLADGRTEAIHDLLFSLGFDKVLLLPLDPRGAGGLLLARTERPFESHEVDDLVELAVPLGPALSQLAQKRRQALGEKDSTREIGVLFDLARELSQATTAEAAARAASGSLHRLLHPSCGAIVLGPPAPADSIAVAWPDGECGMHAVARAAAAAGVPVPRRIVIDAAPQLSHGANGERAAEWLNLASPSGSVGLALSFDGHLPESAFRVTNSVQASLALAVQRFSEQQQREEDRLRAVVDALPHGVLLLAPDGRIRLHNPAARQMLHALSAWPGDTEPLERLASADLRPLLDDARAGRSAQADIFVAPGGRTLELQAVPAGPLPATATAAREVVVVIEDVTLARRHKAQLARAEKLSALGVLISGVVHEINNPLATILGYAQMLASSPAAPNGERWVATIEEEARRCQRIVGNLLAFARPQEPGRRLVALAPIAEKALSLVAYPYRKASIEAVLQASADTPAIDADPDAMLQLLINLLTNALHALEGHPGERAVRVEIGPAPGGRVEVAVRDTGPGIAPEHVDRVFDPFFTTKPEGKGTGLGLSLVAATVRDHGGLIEVESAPYAGACFRILLPGTEPGAATPVEPARIHAPLRKTLQGTTVLVVDDEPAVAGLLAELLEQSGAQATVEPGGRRALAAILDRAPDAVIWDLSMSDLPGSELVEELERIAPHVVPRLIFASGDLVANGPECHVGICPVLRKPFDLAVVVKTVASVCRGRSSGADEPLSR